MSVTPETCFHLTVAIVREIHAEVIAKFGGSPGVRDLALLESAVAAPLVKDTGRRRRKCRGVLALRWLVVRGTVRV